MNYPVHKSHFVDNFTRDSKPVNDQHHEATQKTTTTTTITATVQQQPTQQQQDSRSSPIMPTPATVLK